MNDLKKYLLSIKDADGVEYKSESENLFESFMLFSPKKIKSKLIVNVKSKDKEYESILFVPRARRLFANEFALKLFVRNIQRSLQ